MTRELTADCSRCAAWCCVALPFTRSADFAFDKPAGVACRHLAATRCRIHNDLRARGFAGCATYDCFGAGQHVTQHTFGGGGGRPDPAGFAVFRAVQQLHEMLFHLDEVRHESPSADALFTRIVALADRPDGEVTGIDVAAVRIEVGAVLADVSRRLRRPGAADHRHADLAGRDLRGAPLRDADLHGAVLIGVDLRGVDLGRADVLGADLRGARVGGTRMCDVLFLTRPQLSAAVTDARTTVPRRLR